MKKSIYLVIAVIVFFASSPTLAQEMKDQMMGKEMKEKGMMMGQGMKDEGMMQMHGMMGKASMVSSGDGGVIVMIGKTLYKYDKNLNLVKQVDLPMDTPDMKMMDKMSDKKGMMEKKGCGCAMCAKKGMADQQQP